MKGESGGRRKQLVADAAEGEAGVWKAGEGEGQKIGPIGLMGPIGPMGIGGE